MRKISLVAILIVSLLCSVSPTYADSIPPGLSADQIDALVEYAIENDQEPISVATLSNQYGDSYYVDVYAVDSTELTNILGLLKVPASDDTHSITFVADLANAVALSGNLSREDWDPTASVKVYSTVYFDERYVDDYGRPTKKQYLVTKGTGGYTISDTFVTVQSQSVTIGCNGFGVFGQTTTLNPTSSTFSKSTGFTEYVDTGYSYAAGITYKVTLKRNTSSTWTFTFPNNL